MPPASISALGAPLRGVEQRHQAVFAGPVFAVIVDEIAHHLGAGAVDLAPDPSALHVEMPVCPGPRPDMGARLDLGPTQPLQPQSILDGAQDVVI